MNSSRAWLVLSGLLFVQPALAQRAEPVNSLARARATFDATDANKDGRVSFEELKGNALPIQKADFEAQDVDHDGTWSREEFLVYYRQLLSSSGQRAADDLESEVTRIQALRKAKQADAGTKTPQGTSAIRTPRNPVRVTTPPNTDAPVAPTASNIEARLDQAIEELEKKAAARQATREDFQRVRDAMVARAKMAEAADPKGEADLQARFEKALLGLEAQARDGKYSREEFGALREMLVKRGREAAKGAEASSSSQGKPDDAPVDIEARLQRALDELEKKAEARKATREDFDRIRDLYMARAKAAMGPGDAAQAREQGTIVGRLSQAVDVLEQKALAGQYSREEFTQLRSLMFAKARAAVSGAPPPPVASEAKPSGNPPAAQDGIEARFENALGDLEKKALARQATREDFSRVREMLIARARAAVKGSAASATGGEGEEPAIAALAAKMQSALERLEQQAKDGKISAEDFAQLRQMIVHRAREAASSIESGSSSPGAAPAEGRKRALDGQKPADAARPAPAPGTQPTPESVAPKNDAKPKEGSRGGNREGTPPAPQPQDPPKDPPKDSTRGSTPQSNPPTSNPPVSGGGRGNGGGGD